MPIRALLVLIAQPWRTDMHTNDDLLAIADRLPRHKLERAFDVMLMGMRAGKLPRLCGDDLDDPAVLEELRGQAGLLT